MPTRKPICPSAVWLATTILTASLAADAVGADEFRLSYRYSFGALLEADITGDLQADGDRVIVRRVENARLDGEAGPELPFLISLADLVSETDHNAPVLSLGGIANDIAICSDDTCVVDFITFDGVMQFLGRPGIYTSPAYGDTMSGGANAGEEYDPASYSLKPD